LNLSEAAQVVAGREVIGRPRDIQEVINYRNVVEYIGSLSNSRKGAHAVSGTKDHAPDIAHENTDKPEISAEITKELILKLHKYTTDQILTEDKTGRFRTNQVVVKNSETGEVSFRPPPGVEVPYLVKDFLSWLNHRTADTHPVLVSGIVQYEIARIHPFVDGNGRVARALATLVLYNGGYDIRRFFSLEEYYDSHSQGYYHALQSVVKNKGDQSAWLEYFVQGMAIELTRIKERVNKLSTDIHVKERMGGKQLFLSDRQIRIVEHIQSIGFLQNKMFGALFPMISEDTILRELHDLLKHGIIVKKGKTKGARYVLKK
jgi:Fic family protein